MSASEGAQEQDELIMRMAMNRCPSETEQLKECVELYASAPDAPRLLNQHCAGYMQRVHGCIEAHAARAEERCRPLQSLAEKCIQRGNPQKCEKEMQDWLECGQRYWFEKDDS